MGLRNHAIEWEDEPVARAPIAVPSPALELQALLHQQIRVRRGIDRGTLRRLLMMAVAAGSAVWLTLLASADVAVSLIA